MKKGGITYIPAAQVVARISRKYNANKVWLWDLLEEEYNIIRGTGCLMNLLEIGEFEYMVKTEMGA